MGVIVPEAHEKRNKKKAERAAKKKSGSGGFAGLLIFVAIVVCVVFVAVNSLTKDSGSNKKSASAVNLSSEGAVQKYSQLNIELVSPVMDTAGVFADNRALYNSLNSMLLDLDRQKGIQIAVLTVPGLNGMSMEEFSLYYAEKWGLGQKGVDNGVLLTVAMQEHEVRIETGYGSEGVLTDAMCSRIIRNVILPQFKAGNYSDGIADACKSMAGILSGDESLVSDNLSKDAQDTEIQSSGIIAFIPFMFFILWIIFIFSGIFLGRRGRMLFGMHMLGHHHYNSHHGGSGHGGFGGFGGSGGGFSGGGGHFGGGGASGRW